MVLHFLQNRFQKSSQIPFQRSLHDVTQTQTGFRVEPGKAQGYLVQLHQFTVVLDVLVVSILPWTLIGDVRPHLSGPLQGPLSDFGLCLREVAVYILDLVVGTHMLGRSVLAGVEHTTGRERVCGGCHLFMLAVVNYLSSFAYFVLEDLFPLEPVLLILGQHSKKQILCIFADSDIVRHADVKFLMYFDELADIPCLEWALSDQHPIQNDPQ